jgi:hypothetical protein
LRASPLEAPDEAAGRALGEFRRMWQRCGYDPAREIQGVRCFAQPVCVELAKEGFTIIAGPNRLASRPCWRLSAADFWTCSNHRLQRPGTMGARGSAADRARVRTDKNYRLTKQFVNKKMARPNGKMAAPVRDRAVRPTTRFADAGGGKNEAGLLRAVVGAG